MNRQNVCNAWPKQSLSVSFSSGSFRGYQQLGANVTRYDGTYQRDWHEAIDLYYELDPDSCQVCLSVLSFKLTYQLGHLEYYLILLLRVILIESTYPKLISFRVENKITDVDHSVSPA